MRALFSLLLPLFLIGDILKICNYNVENLFDLNLDGSEYIEFKDKKRWNSSSFNKKLKNISRVICDLDCDILALEEIENKNALKALLKILKDQNCNYPYYAITNNKNQAINSALISKVKILNSSSIKVDRGRLRSILEVSLNSSMPLKIFVNHWSSQKNGEEKRKIFAKALKNRLKELPKGSEYILIGDFNTDYKKSEVVGYSALDNILDTKLNGRYLRIRDKVNGFYHYNLWLELPYFKRWSYSFFGKKEALDAILIPPSLNDNRNWSYIKGSFGVFKRDYLFKNGYIKRWRMGKNGGGYSDHLPIYAYFKNNNPSFLERLQ
ncbi:MAG: hypothetical protein GXO02_00905, partial [Epsilonproteobacteria bacterium]|nr:hypothetical protein [Campylobacterota bacterium]